VARLTDDPSGPCLDGCSELFALRPFPHGFSGLLLLAWPASSFDAWSRRVGPGLTVSRVASASVFLALDSRRDTVNWCVTQPFHQAPTPPAYGGGVVNLL